jgi:hypothetical protein
VDTPSAPYENASVVLRYKGKISIVRKRRNSEEEERGFMYSSPSFANARTHVFARDEFWINLSRSRRKSKTP